MTINQIEIGEGVVVLEIKGQINFQNTQTLFKAILEIESKARKALILDLKEMEYIDGFGLSALVQVSKKISIMGSKLLLVEVNNETKHILRKTKFERWFDIFETREEAVKSLGFD